MTGARSSIRRRLLGATLTAVTLVWLGALYLVWRAAVHEVGEVFDASLVQEARVLTTLLAHEAAEEAEADERLRRIREELGSEAARRSPLLLRLTAEARREGDAVHDLSAVDVRQETGHEYASSIAFVARHADGRVLLRSPDAPDLDPAIDALSTWTAPDRSLWRVLGLRDAGSGLRVQAAERLEVREEIVGYILRHTLAPLGLSVPLLGLIAWLAVGRGLRPLRRVAGEVERRDPSSLEPVAVAGVPREILPLVEALNRLLGRVARALENERRFTADAVHELRTPLAGIRTQAEVALQSAQPGGVHALRQVVTGVERAAHLVDQLLHLARADARNGEPFPTRDLDLGSVALSVVADLAGQALSKEVELALDAPEGAVAARGDAGSLGVLLRNLVDNAVRYTPAGGQVLVRVGEAEAGPFLEVEDTGPGIPPDQREALFQRFRRGVGVEIPGCGLGLSIVRRIAELHRAELVLGEGSGGRGLSVALRFPPVADGRAGGQG